MKTNYPESKPRKIRVRNVKSGKQLPLIQAENLIDTRAPEKANFGSTFFLNLSDGKGSEKQAWQLLNKRMTKRLRRLSD